MLFMGLQLQDFQMLKLFAQILSADECVDINIVVRQHKPGCATVLTAECEFAISDDVARIMDETLVNRQTTCDSARTSSRCSRA